MKKQSDQCICYPGKHFDNHRPHNQHFICEQKNRSVQNFRTFTVNKNFWQLKVNVKEIKQKPFEPVHEISNNVVCATSKASDQPAHMHSQISAFASRLSILSLLSY